MKYLLVLISLFLVERTFSQDKEAKTQEKVTGKTYTKVELDAEVAKLLEKSLKKVTGKNLVGFSKELLKKEKTLLLKESELEKQSKQLDLNNLDLEKKLISFQSKQQRLIGCLDGIDKQKSKRIGHMVDVISGMRPKSAADVLSVQDAEISVKILAKLAPDKVSKIFNSMDKEISARLQKQYMNMKR
jgi:flagellar motility protein MotE (MotC chaperone)